MTPTRHTPTQLTQPYHAGVVVADLERAIDRYSEIHGIGRWMRLDTDYPARHCGRDTHVANHNAFGFAGTLMFELVEPGEGDTPAASFLSARGEGVFHLGYAVDDPLAIPPGTSVCFEVLSLDPPIVYLDTLEQLGFYIELVPRPVADHLMAALEAVSRGEAPPDIPGLRR
jgi:catechol 2,3-dioxygenase-like lactoylglutathione lyase family enzyme